MLFSVIAISCPPGLGISSCWHVAEVEHAQLLAGTRVPNADAVIKRVGDDHRATSRKDSAPDPTRVPDQLLQHMAAPDAPDRRPGIPRADEQPRAVWREIDARDLPALIDLTQKPSGRGAPDVGVATEAAAGDPLSSSLKLISAGGVAAGDGGLEVHRDAGFGVHDLRLTDTVRRFGRCSAPGGRDASRPG